MFCNYCGKEILNPTKNQKDIFKRRGRAYCCIECGKAYSRKNSSITMSKTNKKYASFRMKENNPMQKEYVKEKVSRKLKGHKPIKIGGNGRGLTVPQSILLKYLLKYNAVAEYTISTKGLRGDYPKCYKIDIALPDYKIAIEIDGNSHRALNRKKEDIKKTNFLKEKGWTTIRFWNKEINEDIETCTKKIEVLLNEIST